MGYGLSLNWPEDVASNDPEWLEPSASTVCQLELPGLDEVGSVQPSAPASKLGLAIRFGATTAWAVLLSAKRATRMAAVRRMRPSRAVRHGWCCYGWNSVHVPSPGCQPTVLRGVSGRERLPPLLWASATGQGVEVLHRRERAEVWVVIVDHGAGVGVLDEQLDTDVGACRHEDPVVVADRAAAQHLDQQLGIVGGEEPH